MKFYKLILSLTIDEITSNVIIDSKTGLFNENIYIGLTNDQDSNENNEQMTIEISEQMSQREKKMQDRWSRSIAADGSERPTNTPLIGIDFPQIAVLRRKFSTSKKLKPEVGQVFFLFNHLIFLSITKIQVYLFVGD